MRIPPPFPAEKPAPYLRLDDEPPFIASRHLALEKPAAAVTLAELGYDESDIARRPSPLAITSAFRIFSDEGVAAANSLAEKMKSNRNESDATGKGRLGAFIRGAGYRSQFMRDFCESPELLDFLSEIAGARLARHSVPAVACAINYAPEDISRGVDSWHVDSVSFDAVILLSDPNSFKGGEFQYFLGGKKEGAQILGVTGEEGASTELPPHRICTVDFPDAGFGFLQQGNILFHRACRLLEKAERITLVPSFVVADSKLDDGTNSDAMSRWQDPGILSELARHEAWKAVGKLERLINQLPLSAERNEIADAISDSIADLEKYRDAMKKQ